jgi:hypothetical protein
MHVRFDERDVETGYRILPRHISTLPASVGGDRSDRVQSARSGPSMISYCMTREVLLLLTIKVC